MRRSWRWILGGGIVVLLALLVATAAALGLALEASASVPPRADITPADIDRAIALARAADPRRAPPGQPRRLVLSERDADLLLFHAAQRWLSANTRVHMLPGQVRLQASLAAPFGRWFNVELRLRETDRRPRVDALSVGRLPLSPALALPLLDALASRRGVQLDALLAVDWIQQVRLVRGYALVRYTFGPETANQLRAALVAPGEQQRLQAYNTRLVEITRDSGAAGDSLALAPLLGPMFRLAAERGAAGADAAAENRAALVVLAFFANRRPLGLVVPDAYEWPRPPPLRVTLLGREDFALHFLISAVIAAESSTPVADAVGLWKELADTRRGGSGFSFNDIAADRAGTRLGEAAVHDAARLQARLAAGVGEADIMPPVADLPEGLSEAEMVARFGGVGAPAYQRLMSDIESRIDALPLLR
jgi:hypothetical protein